MLCSSSGFPSQAIDQIRMKGTLRKDAGAAGSNAREVGGADFINSHKSIEHRRDQDRAASMWFEGSLKEGGIGNGAPPLEVTFPPGEARGRFVRLQIPSPAPIFFHLTRYFFT